MRSFHTFSGLLREGSATGSVTGSAPIVSTALSRQPPVSLGWVLASELDTSCCLATGCVLSPGRQENSDVNGLTELKGQEPSGLWHYWHCHPSPFGPLLTHGSMCMRVSILVEVLSHKRGGLVLAGPAKEKNSVTT